MENRIKDWTGTGLGEMREQKEKRENLIVKRHSLLNNLDIILRSEPGYSGDSNIGGKITLTLINFFHFHWYIYVPVTYTTERIKEWPVKLFLWTRESWCHYKFIFVLMCRMGKMELCHVN